MDISSLGQLYLSALYSEAVHDWVQEADMLDSAYASRQGGGVTGMRRGYNSSIGLTLIHALGTLMLR